MTTSFAPSGQAQLNGHGTLIGHARTTAHTVSQRAPGRFRKAVARIWPKARRAVGDVIAIAAFDAALWSLPIGAWSTVAGLGGLTLLGLAVDRWTSD